MGLEVRGRCEKCVAVLPHEGPAYICSVEGTFCATSAEGMAAVCPNCGGELVARPRRRAKR